MDELFFDVSIFVWLVQSVLSFVPLWALLFVFFNGYVCELVFCHALLFSLFHCLFNAVLLLLKDPSVMCCWYKSLVWSPPRFILVSVAPGYQVSCHVNVECFTMTCLHFLFYFVLTFLFHTLTSCALLLFSLFSLVPGQRL